MTRLILAAAALAVAPTFANAQQLPIAYVEGAIGISVISDFDTNPFSATVPGSGTFIGRVETDYEAEYSGGAEAGIATGRWRFGASWDFSHAKADRARTIGTLNGVPVNTEATGNDLDALGVSLDKSINIIAGNLYYNVGDPDWTVRPFFGAGLGAAIIENASTEFAAFMTIGARFPLGDRTYVGGRYRLTRIGGPEEDGSGVTYDVITLHTFSLILGIYFGG